MPCIVANKTYLRAHWFPWMHAEVARNCGCQECSTKAPHKSKGIVMYVNEKGFRIWCDLCEEAARAFCKANGLRYEWGISRSDIDG